MLFQQTSFRRTKYRELYESTNTPKFQFEIFGAVRELIASYARNHASITEEDVNDFMSRLQRETMVLGGVEEVLSEVQSIAVRLWTSAQKLSNKHELCSIFNEAIRKDNEQMMPSVIAFAKTLNLLCANAQRSSKVVQWPSVTYRGGALPREHHQFFQVGKQFRVPQFLSTTKKQAVAYEFARWAGDRGEEPVIWEFHFHEIFRCAHVNLLSKSNVEGEEEFLFTAYSAFTVRSIEIKSDSRWTAPHKVVLDVCPDNRDCSEDVPLAPWFVFFCYFLFIVVNCYLFVCFLSFFFFFFFFFFFSCCSFFFSL